MRCKCVNPIEWLPKLAPQLISHNLYRSWRQTYTRCKEACIQVYRRETMVPKRSRLPLTKLLLERRGGERVDWLLERELGTRGIGDSHSTRHYKYGIHAFYFVYLRDGELDSKGSSRSRHDLIRCWGKICGEVRWL